MLGTEKNLFWENPFWRIFVRNFWSKIQGFREFLAKALLLWVGIFLLWDWHLMISSKSDAFQRFYWQNWSFGSLKDFCAWICLSSRIPFFSCLEDFTRFWSKPFPFSREKKDQSSPTVARVPGRRSILKVFIFRNELYFLSETIRPTFAGY